MTPTISILLPVCNAAPFLQAAVGSVLAQSFRNFELLAIDDGSTDDSASILAAFNDSRIRVISHAKREGLVAALNRGMSLAKGEYIARMDADDVALPHRLERQMAFLGANRAIGVCGSAFEPIGTAPSPCWVRYYSDVDLRVALLFENPICHPTVLLRRSLIEAGLRYPAEYPHAEDYAFWVEVASRTDLANLPDVLLQYRTHQQQVSARHGTQQAASMQQIATKQLQRLGLEPTRRDLLLHQLLGAVINPVPGYGKHIDRWVARLLDCNRQWRIYEPTAFSSQLSARAQHAKQRIRQHLASLPRARALAWQFKAWLRYHRANSLAPT